MRLLRRADQVYIAKRLAAIYYIAVHWRDDEWPEFVEKIVSSVADIAFRIEENRKLVSSLYAALGLTGPEPESAGGASPSPTGEAGATP